MVFHPLLSCSELIYASVAPSLGWFARPPLVDRCGLDVPRSDRTLGTHVELQSMELPIDAHAHDLPGLRVKRDDRLRTQILESL